MKRSTLAVAAGVSAPLILAAPSDGGYVGISHVLVPNDFGLYVSRVYAEFDNPGGDWVQAIGGTPITPLYITVASPGAFYNHPVGTDRAPSAEHVAEFPSLAFDSFYTIGIAAVAAGQTDYLDLVNLPPLAGTSIFTINAAWGLIPPTSDQGNPFDPVNSYPGDGRVLIGQFSTEDGQLISGGFLIQVVSDGEVIQSQETFATYPSPCPWDCGNENNLVDLLDFLALLEQWGVVGAPCDVDGNGVGINDLLGMLAHWGPCP